MDKPYEMRVPMRAAPPPPVQKSSSQISNWENDLFGENTFTDTSKSTQKRKPPPRPPPPKIDRSLLPKPDVPQRPAYFNRKPTILSTLMSKKTKPVLPPLPSNTFKSHMISPPIKPETNTVSLIDFSSPPSSPTLTTRSSSDGLSVDSFGSDITTSTANGATANMSGGNSSQAESGFEDDFDLMSSPKTVQDSDNQDSWAPFDPFSPPLNSQKLKVNRPVYDSDFLDPLCNGKNIVPAVQTNKIPTIIRTKPARPKPPKAASLISSSISEKSFQPSNYQPSNVSSLKQQDDKSKIFEDGDYSPPMPSIPPPPPPAIQGLDNTDDPAIGEWTLEEAVAELDIEEISENEEPFGIALYDFSGTQDDDLPFKTGDKIRLLNKLNDEWYHGKLRSGIEGMFPINYIEIKVPLQEKSEVKEAPPKKPNSFVASVIYDFFPQQEGDLALIVGCQVNVTAKINDEWLYGRMGSTEGQFPRNYVSDVPFDLLDTK